MARDFKEEITDNRDDSLDKTIYWESDPYDLEVMRWMQRVYLDRDLGGTSG